MNKESVHIKNLNCSLKSFIWKIRVELKYLKVVHYYEDEYLWNIQTMWLYEEKVNKIFLQFFMRNWKTRSRNLETADS